MAISKILVRWLVAAATLLIASQLLAGFQVSSLYLALIAALVLSVLNLVIRPILLVLTLPINLLTLGLFTFVINGSMIWLMSTFLKGVTVDSFLAAIAVAMMLWASSTILKWLTEETD